MKAEDHKRAERATPSWILEAIADAVPALLAYVDRQERYRYANVAYGRVVGRSAKEIVGERVADVVPDAAYREVSERLRRALAGEPQTFELTLEEEGGRKRVWDARYRPADREGGVVVYAADVTERRLLETRLQRARRLEALGEMAGEVAHDFKNLVSAILLPCQLLQETVSEEATEELAEIESACDRATALAQRLVRFATVGALERGDQHLGGVVERMAPILRRLAGRGVLLTLDLNDRNEDVMADVVELERIILNLVVNAKHAMPDGGRLTIRTSRVGPRSGNRSAGDAANDRVVLEIEDDGVGMDEDTRARVFEPFFSTRAGEGGSGLGLATVRRIVRDLGGSISVDSVPGEGSVFRILLPTARSDLESAEGRG